MSGGSAPARASTGYASLCLARDGRLVPTLASSTNRQGRPPRCATNIASTSTCPAACSRTVAVVACGLNRKVKLDAPVAGGGSAPRSSSDNASAIRPLANA